MNKNIILAGAMAAGLYLLSQGKKSTITTVKKKAPQRSLHKYYKPKIKKAIITSTQAARKQRERIAAAQRAVLQNAKKIREQMAAENREAAARKKKKHLHS